MDWLFSTDQFSHVQPEQLAAVCRHNCQLITSLPTKNMEVSAVLFAESSDAVQIVTILCAMVSAMGVSLMAYLMARLKQGQEKAAEKVDIVAEKADVVAQKVAEVAWNAKEIAHKTDAVATEVEKAKIAAVEVKKTLHSATECTTARLDKLVEVSNGRFSTQLKLTAIFARRLAETTGKPEDAEAAARAEKECNDHMAEIGGSGILG